MELLVQKGVLNANGKICLCANPVGVGNASMCIRSWRPRISTVRMGEENMKAFLG